jgi:hypothetical protein
VRLEDLADAMRTLHESRQKKIVICPVGLGLKIEALVLRYGMDQHWTVQESSRCPEDKVLLINVPGVWT